VGFCTCCFHLIVALEDVFLLNVTVQEDDVVKGGLHVLDVDLHSNTKVSNKIHLCRKPLAFVPFLRTSFTNFASSLLTRLSLLMKSSKAVSEQLAKTGSQQRKPYPF
jgi:hypothetical protein